MPGPSPASFDSFGELLKYLRRRAQLTQRKLGIAVGYSDAQIARLENGTRPPDPLAVKTVFVEALGIQDEPELAECLVRLAATARGEHLPTTQGQRPWPSQTNLPTQLTRFVGRARELTEVVRLLGVQRLVTLSGAAGMGKTRLALEAGRAALDQFADGVWLVELAPLADAAQVPPVVAATFKIPDRSGRPPLDTLTAFLAEKHILLILDNCEHLIEACARLAEDLLRVCPRLHLLATSREALRIPGEALWRVPPLDMPNPAHPPPPERLADYDAVQLFVAYAALAQPGFTLTPDNLAAVARVCQRLDGMPLALEMAAAQVADLGLGGVATRLDDRFALLTSGSRTALPHHQTLRATLDWSYQLLGEPERVLLARLSVFTGGWTTKAAQVVCAESPPSPGALLRTTSCAPTLSAGQGSGELGPDDVLPLLLQLVRKSLVATTPQGAEGDTRYHLLETVRQYADEKLRACGEGEVLRTRDRHLAHYLALAEETMDLGGRYVDAWVRRIDPEYDNLRAAFAWASTRPDQGEAALRLAAALRPYWFQRGHVGEGLAWLDAALSRDHTAPASARARALLAKASQIGARGDQANEINMAEASLTLFRETDDRLGMAWCLEALANNLDDARAGALAEEALALFQEQGSRDGVSRALRALGTAAYRARDRPHAVKLLEQALVVAQEVEDWRDVPVCLARLYDVEPGRALELCVQELTRRREIGDAERIALIMQIFGIFLIAHGEYERARLVLEESVQWRQRASTAPSFWFEFPVTLLALGFSELSLGHVDEAITWLDLSRKLFREAEWIANAYLAQFLIASAMIAQGNLAAAADDTRECLQRFHQYGHRTGCVCALAQTADLAYRRGDMPHATTLLGAAGVFGSELDVTHSWESLVIWRWYQNAQRSVAEPAQAIARAQLGDVEFEAAYTAGQRMKLNQAVAYALAM